MFRVLRALLGAVCMVAGGVLLVAAGALAADTVAHGGALASLSTVGLGALGCAIIGGGADLLGLFGKSAARGLDPIAHSRFATADELQDLNILERKSHGSRG